jgi:RHS repeat-associated protein
MMIAKVSGSSVFYFHQDILGSTRLVTTGSTTNFSSNYTPFGPQYGSTGTDPTYKFTGKPQDTPTGLYYFAARYYDVGTGRFVSRDPANQPLSDPQTHCKYSYVRNNPELYTDTTGACLDWFSFGVAAVGLVIDLMGVPRWRIPWLQFVQKAWFLINNYGIPLGYLLIRGDILGFAYGLMGGIMWNIVPWVFHFVDFWTALFLGGLIVSGGWQLRLVFAIANFMWSILWSMWSPPSPPWFCF